MELITLELAKAHLYVDTDDDDAIIMLYASAAEQSAQEFLNRRVFKDQATMQAAIDSDTAGPCPMVATDLFRSAVLLILGSLFENRQDVAAGVSLARMPVGAEHLLQPYRKQMGV